MNYFSSFSNTILPETSLANASGLQFKLYSPILDELNGVLMAGEIALERLQKAGEVKVSGAFNISASLFQSYREAPVSSSGLNSELCQTIQELATNIRAV